MQALEDLQELLILLSEKGQRIEALLHEIETIRADVRGLKESLRETFQHEIETHQAAVQVLLGKVPALNGAKSLPEMISSILKAHGTPLHVNEIRSDLRHRYNKEVSRERIESLLYRHAKKVKLFYKVYGRPNTYGLVEWQEQSGKKPTISAR